ncbi:MAG: hypothetical protein U0183_32750 [Polyangiaceae bacterium]
MDGCSLSGTWSYDVDFSAPGHPNMVWSFDAEGRAIGSPRGANLCSGFTWTANYRLGPHSKSDPSPGFDVSDIRGQGAPSCGAPGGTTFDIVFSDACRTAVLSFRGDSCTGGGLFYEGKMTRIAE